MKKTAPLKPEEDATPPEVPPVEVRPEDPSPFHDVRRWVAAMWPWCRFVGVTRHRWPYLGGMVLRESHDLGPFGIVWTDAPRTVWAWEPRGGE